MDRKWSSLAIGDIAQIYDGPHATPTKTDKGPIFLGISNLSKGRLDLSTTEHLSEDDFVHWTRRVEPRPGDVVFSYETRLGEAARIPNGLRCCLGRRMGLLRAHAGKVDSRFLLYAFLAPPFQQTLRQRTVHGSTVDRIPLQEMAGFPIEIPADLAEQRAIANTLGTLDDKIELNRRMNATLEEMARALFKSWFGDFDPVHAKAEGRDTGLPADIAALFPDSFEDSEIGPIPAGWRVAAIGDVVRAVGGATPSTKEPDFWDGDISFATPKDMASLAVPVLLKTERSITGAGVRRISSGRLPRGTVLLSSRAPIGYLAITDIPVAVNQGFIAMICDGPLPNYYVLQWVRQNMEAIIANANGSTFLEISKANFRPLRVLVPSSDILAEYVAQVDPMHRDTVSILRQSQTLAALRDALLPKLISGELRVPDAERLVDDALG